MKATIPQRDAEEILGTFFTDGNEETVLDLSNCGLTEFPASFRNYIATCSDASARIERLNLAGNSLLDLPHCLAELRNLKILFCLGNMFETIPSVVSKLPECYMLSFKNCRLKGMLNAKLLPRKITWLILTSNEIESLSDDFGVQCARVRKLMLSNNRLSELPAGFAKEMTQLELLRLSNNNFVHFPTDVLECTEMKWLSLAGNPCAGGRVEKLSTKFWIDVEEEYAIDWGRGLGEGTSGTVFVGRHKSSRQSVAVKVFKDKEGSDGRALDEAEISLLACGVKGIVAAVGWGTTTYGESVLVSELVPGDARCLAGPPSFVSCTRSVYRETMRFGLEDTQKIIEVVQQGVEGLLERGIAHGDCYAHNVLVGKTNKGEITVVLGDLGAAWRFTDSEREAVEKIERRALSVFEQEMRARVIRKE